MHMARVDRSGQQHCTTCHRTNRVFGPSTDTTFVHAGRGQFTAALEVQESQRLVMSFLHHMALQRLCRNPFEKGEVAGITNYLDIGLQVIHPLSDCCQGLACML